MFRGDRATQSDRKQALPWSITGIPPEARDVARAAASREGLSVGDWLTRRILGEEAQPPSRERPSERISPTLPSYRPLRSEETRREREELFVRIAEAEAETESAFRNIDDTLRLLTRRLEANERSQGEASRLMGAAAAEINAAVRDQAQVFSNLTERIHRVENHSDGGTLKEAVQGLHRGLSKLADQIARTATEATGQIGALAANVESIAGKMAAIRDETARSCQQLEGQVQALAERVKASEEAGDGTMKSLRTALGLYESRLAALEPTAAESERNAHAIQELERSLEQINLRLTAVETRAAQAEDKIPDALTHHLAAIERNLDAIVLRLDTGEKQNREALAELRSNLEETSRRLNAVAKPTPTPYAAMVPPLGDEPPPEERDIESPVQPRTPEDAPPPPFGPATYHAPQEPATGRPTAQDFLDAARRAAQSAVGAEEQGLSEHVFAGFASAGESQPNSGMRRTALIGAILFLILAAAIAGILLTRGLGRPVQWSPSMEVGTLFNQAKPELPSARRSRPASSASSQRVNTSAQAPASEQATRASLDRLMAKAKSGEAKAELVLGLTYLDGNGVGTNASEAARWLKRAAEHGEAFAQYRLGTLYELGRGVPADMRQAHHWYAQGAKNGNRKAMHNLAVSYAQGTGTQQSLDEAAHWFTAAAELGLVDSQYNLAVLFERGLGVPLSLSEAYRWYAIAASQGDAGSQARLAALGTQLSAAERDAAKKAAKNFQPEAMSRDANTVPELAQVVR